MDDLGDDPLDESAASRKRAARLKELFKDIEPIEITAIIDIRGKNSQEIAQLLPKFTVFQEKGANPAFGILIDPASGRAWSLRSGLSPDVEETVNGIRFKTGTMTTAIAEAAGWAWGQPGLPLGAHVEGQAAAFMRRMNIVNGILYINGSTPCHRDGRGCLFNLPELLAEGSTLTVFNKNGRKLDPFSGVAD